MGLLDNFLEGYRESSGLLNQSAADAWNQYQQFGKKFSSALPDWLNQGMDSIQEVVQTPGVETLLPMTALIKNNPRLLQATLKEARAADEAVKSNIIDWLLGKAEKPTGPVEVYRGIPKGAKPVVNETGYTHATPWQYDAGRAGKGAFGDFNANDIYRYDTDASTKYYRGGSLAGDPFESTKINSAGGMTWDEILDQARPLYKQELHKINQKYLNEPMRESLSLDRWTAEKIAQAVRNAAFEADIGNKPGIWSGHSIPPALGKESPVLRSNTDLMEVINNMRNLGLSEEEIVKLPEYIILKNAGRL